MNLSLSIYIKNKYESLNIKYMKYIKTFGDRDDFQKFDYSDMSEYIREEISLGNSIPYSVQNNLYKSGDYICSSFKIGERDVIVSSIIINDSDTICVNGGRNYKTLSDYLLQFNIKTDKYQFISDINISNISIFYDSVLDIKLNIRPTLNIKIGKWINKKMVHEEHKLLYEMKEWSQFKLINKLDIDLHNINYIIIDGNDFLYIDNYIENIDKLDSIYLRLFI
jgi:hypothetical protein